MKKSFALFLVLLCLASGSLIGMGVWVGQKDEQVEVTQTTLRGEPSAAQGLTVTLRNQIMNGNQMFWETSFPAQDASQAQTQFEFFYQMQYSFSDAVMVSRLILPSVSSGGVASDTGIGLENGYYGWLEGSLLEPALVLADTMEPNQTEVLHARLADYYDAYPVSLDDYTWRYDDETWREQVERNMEALQDFFQIPVSPELYVTYTLITNELGEVIELDTETQQKIQANSKEVAGKGGYYYILDSYATSEEVEQGAVLLDLSHIRDGYGIYFIPVYVDPATGSQQVDAEKIQTVYAVPEGERTVDLYVNTQGSLLLYTVAGETWYLNVLSGDGRQLLQRLELGELGSRPLDLEFLEGENYLLLLAGEKFYLLTWDGNQYALKHVLEMPTDEMWDSMGKDRVAYWDGQRLALLEQGRDWPGQTGYRLTVWQAGELAYQGEYDLSFYQDNAVRIGVRVHMLHGEEEPLKLSG